MDKDLENELTRTIAMINREQVFTRNELLSRSKVDVQTVDTILKQATSHSVIEKLQNDIYVLVKNIDLNEQSRLLKQLIEQNTAVWGQHANQIEGQRKSIAKIFEEIEQSVKE